jgi:phosphatidylglycerophosphate synthase
MAWHEADHFRGIRGFSDRCASWFAWATPNLITLASLVLTVPMIWSFATGRIALGATCFVLSAIGDFLDGAVARYQHDRMSVDERLAQGEKNFLLQRGQSEGGLNLDPFTDKVRYFGALIPLGWSLLDGRLLGPSIAIAAGLTVGRPLLKWLIVRLRLPEAQGVGKANKFGKFKAHVEIGLIALLIISHAGVTTGTFSAAFHYAAFAALAAWLITAIRDVSYVLRKNSLRPSSSRRLLCLAAIGLQLEGYAFSSGSPALGFDIVLAAAMLLGGLSLGGQVYTFYKRWRAAKIKTTSV